MNDWKLTISFKNGTTINGIYSGTETNSKEVGALLLRGDSNTFVAIASLDKKSQIYYRLDEIVTLIVGL